MIVLIVGARRRRGGQACPWPHGTQARAPLGERLLGVGGLPPVPDQPVLGGTERSVEGDSELDGGEARREGFRRETGATRELATRFIRQLRELPAGEPP